MWYLSLFIPHRETWKLFFSLRYQHDSVPSGFIPVYPRKSVMASSIRDPRVNDKGDFSLLLLYSEMNTIMDHLCLSQKNLCVWQKLSISVDTDKFVCSFSTLKFLKLFIFKIINLSYLMSKIAKHPYPLTRCRFQLWLRKADSEMSLVQIHSSAIPTQGTLCEFSLSSGLFSSCYYLHIYFPYIDLICLFWPRH